MRSGKLQHLIQIQQLGPARDSFGQNVDTWAVIGTCYAKIVGLSGREIISRSGEVADATHRIEMRAFAALKPKHRIVFGARIFDVLYVSDIDLRGIEMHVIVKELIL